MQIITVATTSDHLKKIAQDVPIKALSELIWNSFDARATNVKINFIENDLGAIDSIMVTDDGEGINNNELNSSFGSLGNSWKKSAKKKSEYDYLHGENGQGRFKSFSLGDSIEWDTIYTHNNEFYQYKIKSHVNNIMEFNTSSINNVKLRTTGTIVTVFNVTEESNRDFRSGCDIRLAEIFCMYLSKYNNKKLFLNTNLVSPSLVQKHVEKMNLGDIKINDDLKIDLKLNIVEWNDKVKSNRQVNYCDVNGFTLHEEKIDKKMLAVDSKFTVFAESDYFRECYDKGTLNETGLSTELTFVKDIIIDKTREYFINKKIKARSEIVDTWIDEDIYPYEKDTNFNPVIEAEKKVFDILAVNVQTYLKRFEKSDKKTKKFTFKLLKQAIEDNPKSVKKIINEVLDLTKEEQNELANLLDKTTLSSIISASKVVTDRLNTIKGLEQLLFEKESKKALLERDQLHKLLEKEAWIFREDFYLAGSEENLNEVLSKHLKLLGTRCDDDSKVIRPDGSSGRIDLMLSKSRQPKEGKIEHLVVELKRPSQKIDANVIAQIKSYAFAVSKDERFDKKNTDWTFIAVSNELDDYAKQEIEQQDRARGLIYKANNITVWIYEWSEIFNMAKARLSFFQKQLGYEASRSSATEYLLKTYEKFIPKNFMNPVEKESIVSK